MNLKLDFSYNNLNYNYFRNFKMTFNKDSLNEEKWFNYETLTKVFMILINQLKLFLYFYYIIYNL